MRQLEERYLERLSQLYPTIAKASTEIINLQAILNLPKGTEHFLTDIHGEYEAFAHVLKNGSGSVRRKIDDVFGNTLSSRDKQALATLIYYPKEKMDRIKKTEKNMEDWYFFTFLQSLCYHTTSVCCKEHFQICDLFFQMSSHIGIFHFFTFQCPFDYGTV